jgi:hypothetical protein
MIDGHPDEKSLIFCQFRGEMNYIQSQLKGPVFRIDGSVPKEERVSQIEGFKKAAPVLSSSFRFEVVVRVSTSRKRLGCTSQHLRGTPPQSSRRLVERTERVRPNLSM